MTEKRSAHWENYWVGASAPDQAVSGDRPGDHFDEKWRAFFEQYLAADICERNPIVDLACGAGVVTQRAIDAADMRALPRLFLGVDYSAGAARKINDLKTTGGSVAFGLAADITQLPLSDRSASLVVSQFGVEYAGARGFSEAGRIVGQGGAVRFICHYKNGSIFEECQENADTLSNLLRSELLSNLRRTFSSADAKAEKKLSRALSRIMTFASKRRGSAAAMASQMVSDASRMVERRRAFDPNEVIAWCDGMRREIEQYRFRMLAMVSSALDRRAVENAVELLGECGLDAEHPSALHLTDSEPPTAWIIDARRV